MDKSASETNLTLLSDVTPPNYISQRPKRKRNEIHDTDFDSFKEEMKQMIQSYMTSHEQELKKITPTLKDIQQSNHNIETSVAFLSSQNEELKKKIDQLEVQAKKDREYITILEEKIEDVQRSNRKTSFEIKNVPKKINETREDLINYVRNLSENIGCKLDYSDIRDIHRVQTNKEGKNNTPIIIETNSTMLKSDILKMCKTFNIKNKDKLRAKHLGLTINEDSPIFVSEQLTAKGSRLFFLARDVAKSKNYKFCWTSFGRVYLRKDENSRITQIKNELQVQHLMQTE